MATPWNRLLPFQLGHGQQHVLSQVAGAGGEAFLHQEPARVHGQWVERLAVTWQGLLSESPFSVGLFFRQLLLLFIAAHLRPGLLQQLLQGQ